MAATGKTPILLYGSTTATNAPVAGNLTNSSDGCEIAINVADKNLFFKDSTNTVNTVPIRQSSASSNGWLSSTDWSTFNGKAPAFTYTSGYIPFGQGTTTPNQSANLSYSGGVLYVLNSGLYLSNSYNINSRNNANTIYIPMIGRNSSDQVSIDPDGYGTLLGFSGYQLQVSGGNATLQNGNLVIGTSGKGIDFSATANTGTSELLADYEEGTFTVTRSGFTEAIGSGSITNTGNYIKIGNLVKVTITLTCAGGATLEAGSGALASVNLPFTPAVKTSGTWCNSSSLTTAGSVFAQTNGNLYVVTGWSATESAWTLETSFIV